MTDVSSCLVVWNRQQTAKFSAAFCAYLHRRLSAAITRSDDDINIVIFNRIKHVRRPSHGLLYNSEYIGLHGSQMQQRNGGGDVVSTDRG